MFSNLISLPAVLVVSQHFQSNHLKTALTFLRKTITSNELQYTVCGQSVQYVSAKFLQTSIPFHYTAWWWKENGRGGGGEESKYPNFAFFFKRLSRDCGRLLSSYRKLIEPAIQGDILIIFSDKFAFYISRRLALAIFCGWCIKFFNSFCWLERVQCGRR